MAGLNRKTNFPFAVDSVNTGEFGSAQLGTKILTNDPLVIQGTTGSGSTLAPSTAWNAGWVNAVIGGNNLPPLEEMEGVQAVASYQISYLLARGIAEYDSGTTYNAGDITRPPASSQLYQSIGNANVGNALPSAVTNSFWKYLGDLQNLGTSGSLSVLGNNLNAKMSVTSASTTATFTADSIAVATSLSGTVYNLSSYSETINLATTGAGGMDTGSAPVSGYIALYAIYGTAGTSILAQDVTSSIASEIYSGAHMPSGYTASALLSVWPTNGSSQFVVGYQSGESIFIDSINVLNSSTVESSFISLSLSGAIPKNAKTWSGWLAMTSSASAANLVFSVAGAGSGTSGIGQQVITCWPAIGGQGITSVFSNIPIITPQTTYYYVTNSSGTLIAQLVISSYTI